MAYPGFGHLWQQEDMSDVEIVISFVTDAALVDDEDSEAQTTDHVVLQQFPGHSVILSLCPYLLAQALRWSTEAQSTFTEPGNQQQAKDTAGSKQQAKQVTITLPDASYEPAAMALLAGLYHVHPWSKLLADLTPQQQVQAAVLADMWQLTAASEAALEVLVSATDDTDSLAAVLEEMLDLRAVPECLLPVFEQSWQVLLSRYSSLSAVPQSMRPLLEQILLSKYGDLEAVWAPGDGTLQKSLLALPVYAMELLLASDKLKVASEDTVLYTAQAYKLVYGWCRQPAVDKLAPLVRCPHLSQFWLSALVLSGDADKLLLGRLQPQLKRLLLLRQAGSTDQHLTAEEVSKYVVPGAPASWLLPVRDIQPVSSAVLLDWEVDVATIRRAAHESASQKDAIRQWSPTSCLLGGVRWSMQLLYAWDSGKQSSRIGLYAHARNLPAGSICRCTYSLECVGVTAVSKGEGCRDPFFNRGWGYENFFKVGFMSGGFDEAAWAAQGLPTSGSMLLRLTVKEVGV